MSQFFSCCCWPVDAVVFLAAGAGVVYLSRGLIVEQGDALVNGAVTGLISGLIGGLLYALLAILTQVIVQLMDVDYSTICGSSYQPPTILESTVISFVCCLPTIVAAGVILGALGALLYSMVAKRKQPGSV